jgi:hypothetical protein
MRACQKSKFPSTRSGPRPDLSCKQARILNSGTSEEAITACPRELEAGHTGT